ncbi:MAG: isopeptide-forming domain-containing fimbrial protein [Oscillospiraceae bacterium]|nr:isopeptide-forming domain-containing fimbrial protein [Oscillospiraceae bacterium]
MTEEQRELYVRALEETALAYFRRRDRVQYDSVNLTHLDRFNGGSHRKTDGVAPESATKDSYLFTVCSSFGYNMFYNAFGYELCGSPLLHTCRVVLEKYKDHFKFAYDSKEPGEMKTKAAIRAALAAMKPGDVFVIRNDKAQNYHYMTCISGNRLIHSGGTKLNMKTGEEKWDSPGSIRVDDIDEFLLNVLGDYPFFNFAAWWVIDVLDAIDPEKYPLTPSAQSRLAYPGLNIDRTVSVRAHQTVQAGDTVTVTLQLQNDNTAKSKLRYEDLEIVEKLPAHTTLLDSSLTADTVVDGDTLRWKLSFAPGEERIIQYTVRVDDDAPVGGELVFGGGRVAQIPSNEIRRLVSKPRPDAKTCAALYALAKKKPKGGADWAYAQIGKQVKIPTAWELISGLYEFYEVDDVYGEEDGAKHDVMRAKKKQSKSALDAMKMAVPTLLGGKMLTLPTAERVKELRGENLYPGDVIVAARELTREGCREEQWTMLGGGKALRKTPEGTEVVDLPYLDIMLVTDYFVVLRPYLI